MSKEVKSNKKNRPENKEKENNPPLLNSAHYIKDLSFENPGVLKSDMTHEEGPSLNIDIHVDVKPVAENIYEAVILLNIKADAKGSALFLVELSYGGIFKVEESLSEKEKKRLLLVDAPSLLFPFARSIVATVTRDGGLPPLLLNPVDFEALSHQEVHTEEKTKH
jgi:preprotein translocase subunit SecB